MGRPKGGRLVRKDGRGRPLATRYLVGPLIAHLDSREGIEFHRWCIHELGGVSGLDRRHAEAVGVSPRTITRWRGNPLQSIDANTADSYATALDLHPSAIWPEWADWANPKEMPCP